MKKDEVKVGSTYLIHHGHEVGLTKVRVLGVRQTMQLRSQWGPTRPSMTHYRCLKLSTGKEIEVKSAAKFRSEVTE